MEEKIELIKQNLTGDLQKDVEFLNALYEEESRIIDEANTTIEAINMIANALEEMVKEQAQEVEDVNTEEDIEETNVEEKTEEQKEIEETINKVQELINEEQIDEAISMIEKVIEKVEEIDNVNDENTIYCSFDSAFEKAMFERLFAGEKEVKVTTYANDTLYIVYAQLLMSKNKKVKAMAALDRAIYWNFLNREARELKINLFLDSKLVTKALEAINKLQKISYTPADLADCYNKYAYIFNELKDQKSTYAMYKISYSYYQDTNVEDILSGLEEINPDLKDMTADDILFLAQENNVEIGPNANIIKAHRDITKEFIEMGEIEVAKEMLRDDYIMTASEDIAMLYNQIAEISEEAEEYEEVEEVKPEVEETAEEVVEEKPKKRTTRKKAETTDEEKPKAKKTTATKTTKKATAKTTTKKTAAKKAKTEE